VRRILLLITDLQIGGTPTVVRELALRLSSPAVRVDVACLSKMGPVGEVLQSRGIRVTALNARRPTDSGAIARLARLIRRERYDTVFSFLIHANVAAALVSPFFRQIRFLQSIQTTQPEPAWHWFAQGVVHRVAEKIVVPSPSVAQAAIERSSIPDDKIVIIANAIDLEEFPPRPKCDLAMPARIGFIGRLDPIKRVQDLIQAMKLLGDRAMLDIYGEGPERQRLTELVATLELQNQVTFHGSIPSPQPALRQMDVLVLPSQAEGFGLVLIEAMATGIPVVGTDAPGIRNVIQHGTTGLLTPIASPAGLAAAISKLLDDKNLRESLAVAALADVQAKFSWTSVLPQYRELLDLSRYDSLVPC
jgi:glycosyltransferase involved in cell wall biosynthesis